MSLQNDIQIQQPSKPRLVIHIKPLFYIFIFLMCDIKTINTIYMKMKLGLPRRQMVMQVPWPDLMKCGHHFHRLCFLACGHVIEFSNYDLHLNAQIVQFRQLPLNSERQEILKGSFSNNSIV